MEHKLTKFQLLRWKTLNPLLVDGTYETTINFDHELLVYRKSDMGLHNIIIHMDTDIIYSFIGFDGTKELEFYTEETINPEELIKRFYEK
jgi:hypothetical protein